MGRGLLNHGGGHQGPGSWEPNRPLYGSWSERRKEPGGQGQVPGTWHGGNRLWGAKEPIDGQLLWIRSYIWPFIRSQGIIGGGAHCSILLAFKFPVSFVESFYLQIKPHSSPQSNMINMMGKENCLLGKLQNSPKLWCSRRNEHVIILTTSHGWQVLIGFLFARSCTQMQFLSWQLQSEKWKKIPLKQFVIF